MISRTCGILLHPTSLPGRFPIGDLGPAAHAFAGFLQRAGQRWWQMLPLGPIDEYDSPYKSSSTFAGNILLLSPERLVDDGFLRARDLPPAGRTRAVVDYPGAARMKRRLLEKAHATFAAAPEDCAWKRACAAFRERERAWLEDFALFTALAEHRRSDDWTRWSPGLRRRAPAALTRARREHADAIGLHVFLQWQFAVQWQALRARCATCGVKLIGDMPFFVAHRSAEVWAAQELFDLDRAGRPTVVAGVPPDYFAPGGQVWNVPLYAWPAMRRERFAWWTRRLRALAERVDLIRLDHFLGMARTFAIPAGDLTAVRGRYRPSPGATLLRAVRAELLKLPLIAEDLGAVTPQVRRLIRAERIPGMRVLQFEMMGALDGGRLPRDGGSARAVIYTGTHDNDTTLGWFQGLDRTQQRRARALLTSRARPFSWAAMADALGRRSRLAIVPMQDVLGLGSAARMNVPGSAPGNWCWRMLPGEATAGLARRLRKLVEETGRSGRP